MSDCCKTGLVRRDSFLQCMQCGNTFGIPINPVARLLGSQEYRPLRVRPRKGKGSYTRKEKHR